jgi:hypothetical protein
MSKTIQHIAMLVLVAICFGLAQAQNFKNEGSQENAGGRQAVVRLTNEKGGNIERHIARFQQLAASGANVEIVGVCKSACTMILGIVPRNRLCATPGTVFEFHAANYTDRYGRNVQNDSWTERMTQFWPENVKNWVAKNNATASMDFTRISAAALGVRTCR